MNSPRAITFLVHEPDVNRWQEIRAGLVAAGYSALAVRHPDELLRTLATLDFQVLIVGAAGSLRHHEPVVARLRSLPRTRVLVTADPSNPQRIAKYLSLGPEVRVVPPETVTQTMLLLHEAGIEPRGDLVLAPRERRAPKHGTLELDPPEDEAGADPGTSAADGSGGAAVEPVAAPPKKTADAGSGPRERDAPDLATSPGAYSKQSRPAPQAPADAPANADPRRRPQPEPDSAAEPDTATEAAQGRTRAHEPEP